MQGFAIVRLLLSHYKQNLCSWLEEFGPQSTLGNQADRQDLMTNLKSFIQINNISFKGILRQKQWKTLCQADPISSQSALCHPPRGFEINIGIQHKLQKRKGITFELPQTYLESAQYLVYKTIILIYGKIYSTSESVSIFVLN